MTLEEYKQEIKNHVAKHNDFNVNVEELFKYVEDDKLVELLNKNTPVAEAAFYCVFAGSKINGKKRF